MIDLVADHLQDRLSGPSPFMLAPIVSEIHRYMSIQLSRSSCDMIHQELRTELDPIDTYAVADNFLVTQVYQGVYEYTIDFDPAFGTKKDHKFVNNALAYDCPVMRQVIVFKRNQTIFIKTMFNSLVCPTQLRMNDIRIFHCP